MKASGFEWQNVWIQHLLLGADAHVRHAQRCVTPVQSAREDLRTEDAWLLVQAAVLWEFLARNVRATPRFGRLGGYLKMMSASFHFKSPAPIS